MRWGGYPVIVHGAQPATPVRWRRGQRTQRTGLGTAMSPWEVTKVIVPLIGIAVVLANLIGLWDLPGQDKAREVRTKARAEQKDWADSIRRNGEELRRQLDEDMRRTFSR